MDFSNPVCAFLCTRQRIHRTGTNAKKGMVIKMEYKYRTRGVCASDITFEIEDGVLKNVSFRGGCNGNLKAISRLVEGMNAAEVAKLLRGNTCGFKKTSCADQLAIAIEEAVGE